MNQNFERQHPFNIQSQDLFPLMFSERVSSFAANSDWPKAFESLANDSEVLQ